LGVVAGDIRTGWNIEAGEEIEGAKAAPSWATPRPTEGGYVGGCGIITPDDACGNGFGEEAGTRGYVPLGDM
jgi:hypothetical protein